MRGTDFLGATAVQQEQDGNQFESTITQLDLDPNDPSGETLLYSLTVTDPASGVVTPFCQTDPSGVAKAIPVAGTWSPGGGAYRIQLPVHFWLHAGSP